MKHTVRWIQSIVLITLFSSLTFGQNLNVTTSPSPAAQGQKMRITIDSGFPLLKGTVVVPGGAKKSPAINQSVKKIAENLFTSNILIPEDYPVGRHALKVYIRINPTKTIMVKVKFEVTKGQPQNITTASEMDKNLLNVSNLDLNMKVDELENNLDRIQQEKRALERELQALKDELEENTPQAQQDEINNKIKELESLLSTINSKLETTNSELQNKLRELADAEKKLQEKEKRLQEIESVLESQETSLQNIEKELEDKNKALLAQQEKLEIQQQNMIQQNQNLATIQDAIDAKESELTQMNSQLNQEKNQLKDFEINLNKKQQTLQDLSQKLDSKDAKVQALLADIQKDQTTLQNKEENLANLNSNLQTKENQLKEKQTTFNQAQIQLNKQRENLKQETSQLNKRNKNLQAQAQHLTSQSQKLNQFESKLRNQDSLLKKQKASIQSKKHALSKKEANYKSKKKQLESDKKHITKTKKRLSNKETTLQNRNRELSDLDNQLQRQQRLLSGKSHLIKNKEGKLLIRSKKLQASKEALTNENQNLMAIKQQFKVEQNMFSDQKSKWINLNKKEQKELNHQKETLDSIQNQISEKEKQINTLEKIQQEKENTLKAQNQKLQQESHQLAKNEQELHQKEQTLIEIKNNVESRYSDIEQLKRWIANKTNELEKKSDETEARLSNEHETFKTQFGRLESITRLLQERSRYLKEINNTLVDRNEDLNIELTELRAGDSNYSIESFLGYKRFGSSRSLEPSAELGIRFIGKLARNIEMASSFGLVPTLGQYGTTSKSETIYTYSINAFYTFYQMKRLNFYGITGIMGDFNKTDSMSLNYGIGLRYLIDEDISTRFNVIGGTNILASLGFEKKIIFNQSVLDPFEKKTQEIQKAIKSNSPKSQKIETHLSAPSSIKKWVFQSPKTDPSFKHWAKKDLQKTTALGLISDQWTENKEVINQPITQMEMVRAISLSNLLTQLPQNSGTTINFSIIELPGIPHKVQLALKQNDKTLSLLIDNKNVFTGNQTYIWNNKIPGNPKASSFTIQLDVIENGHLLGQQRHPITLIQKDKIPIPNTPPLHTFSDIQNKTNLQLINQWIQIGNSVKGPLFKPNQKVKRIDFILNIANLLTHFGVVNKIQADFSPYRDTLHLSKTNKEKLELYISALGYGGDEKKRLRPNQYISLAETSRILTRLLTWIEINQGITPEIQ